MAVFSLKKMFGDSNSAEIGRLESLALRINSLEPEMKSLSDDEIKKKTDSFKLRLNSGSTLGDLLPEAFAIVREAARRTLGERHFDVQLMGGVILHEGKTLVATLPVYLNALEGRGVHVVTVNDYLSRRDAVWMWQIYNMLGLSVA